MVYKTCSIGKVIATFWRKFNPTHSSWVNDAYEWIGEAIDTMKCAGGYGEKFQDIEIIDYRGKLPCEIQSILGFSYKGQRLPRNGGLNHKNLKTACVNDLVSCISESYTLNPNYINTSFKEGCVRLYYLGIDVDCNGLPYVIDDPVYIDALCWYILMQMLSGGYNHPIFKYKDADAMWAKMAPRAKNRCRMPDIDGYQDFKKNWTGATAGAIDMANIFFNSVDFQNLKDEAHDSKDLLQSVNILGSRTG